LVRAPHRGHLEDAKRVRALGASEKLVARCERLDALMSSWCPRPEYARDKPRPRESVKVRQFVGDLIRLWTPEGREAFGAPVVPPKALPVGRRPCGIVGAEHPRFRRFGGRHLPSVPRTNSAGLVPTILTAGGPSLEEPAPLWSQNPRRAGSQVGSHPPTVVRCRKLPSADDGEGPYPGCGVNPCRLLPTVHVKTSSGGQEVPGSNPGSPTIKTQVRELPGPVALRPKGDLLPRCYRTVLQPRSCAAASAGSASSFTRGRSGERSGRRDSAQLLNALSSWDLPRPPALRTAPRWSRCTPWRTRRTMTSTKPSRRPRPRGTAHALPSTAAATLAAAAASTAGVT